MRREGAQEIRRRVNDLFDCKDRTVIRLSAVCVLLSIVCLALCGISVCFARKAGTVPYIVQVDEHGYEVAVGPLQASAVTDERIIIARLGTFVTNWRTVVSDVRAQQVMVEWVYSGIPRQSEAQTKINSWYSHNDPYRSYYDTKITRSVDIKTILKVSDMTWRVEWTEVDYSRGNAVKSQSWTGLFTIGVTPSKDVKDVIKNPLGIYVTDFSVSPDFRVTQAQPEDGMKE